MIVMVCCSDRQYDHIVKGKGQINRKSVYGVLGEHFTPFVYDLWNTTKDQIAFMTMKSNTV